MSIQLVVDGQTFSKAANIGSIADTDSVPIGARAGSEYFKGLVGRGEHPDHIGAGRQG
jgi:hypothetical protein